MIIDKLNEFAIAAPLNAGAAGTYNIGDVIDTQWGAITNTTKDLGFSELYLVVKMSTAATSGGSATGQFRLVSDDTATPSTTTATVHYTSAAIPVASMTAGSTVAVVKLPSGSYERYIGIQQITGTAAFTAGAVGAFLTTDPASWRAYGDAL